MKLKTLFVAALSLAGLGAIAAPASAWHGFNRYSTKVVCRPYNAFTPICRGSLICDGCCPFACPHMGGGASCSPLLGNPMLSMCYDPAAMAGIAPHGMPAPAAPQFRPPMPAPAQPGQQTYAPMMNVPMTHMPMMNMPMMVQPANYNGYYPMYYPTYPMPYQQAPVYPMPYQQAPAYWYGY